MKNIFRISVIILSISLIHSCKKEEVPTLTTSAINNIMGTTATSGGTITDKGSGTIISQGVCWSTAITPTLSDSKTTDGVGADIFISNISGLNGATTYYVRAYATNSAGTGYGNQLSFTTDPLTVSDVEGNIYNVVRIGTQLWMKENLKTTRYNDGTSIPLITDGTAWDNLSNSAYCWYNNDAPTNKNTYGALYNWYTVNTGNLCPTGWHVPTDNEWETLEVYLGGWDVAGGKLKETGTIHWQSPNTGATNKTGFTALPGGLRDVNRPYPSDGPFLSIGDWGYWWSSTEDNDRTYLAWLFNLGTSFNHANRGGNYKEYGFSVRCIRDN